MEQNTTRYEAQPEEDHSVASLYQTTTIPISGRVFAVILILGVVASIFLVRAAPSVLTILLGGAALGLLLSFPVRLLTRVMPRGLAILLTFLALIGLIVLTAIVFVPLLIDQLVILIDTFPAFMNTLNSVANTFLQRLQERGLVSTNVDTLTANAGRDILNTIERLAQQVLDGLVGGITGTFSLAIQIFGMLFVAVYLLIDIRKIKAAYLRVLPKPYRDDGGDLWNSFATSLTQYIGGLVFIMAVQGVLSAVALWLVGVPYALLLGLWVALTAVIPYIGAWLGAIPAVVLALTISPTTALITGVVFLAIQQLEGNFLTPRIQGNAVRVHPILVLLAVTAGGELFGLAGVLFAVPLVAVLRVLFDFFRARVRIKRSPGPQMLAATPVRPELSERRKLPSRSDEHTATSDPPRDVPMRG